MHEIQVLLKIDFAKYPVLINLSRHKSKQIRYQMICTSFQNLEKLTFFLTEMLTTSKLSF